MARGVLELADDRRDRGRVRPDPGPDEQQARDHGHQHADDAGVRPELGVPKQAFGLAVDDVPEQREVRPGSDHEGNDDPLHDGRKRLDRAGLGREPPCRHRRERMRDGVERIHVRCEPGEVERVEEHHLEEGEAEIREPEHAGGLGDAWRELLDTGAGRFGVHQLRTPDREFGEDRDREHDDPHPAEPLGELSPQEQGVGVTIERDLAHHGRSRGGEAAHRLEQRVRGSGERRLGSDESREEIGDRPDERDDEPRERDHQEPLARAEVGVGIDAFESDADRDGDGERDGERRFVRAVVQRHPERNEQHGGEVFDDRADEPDARPPVHAKPVHRCPTRRTPLSTGGRCINPPFSDRTRSVVAGTDRDGSRPTAARTVGQGCLADPVGGSTPPSTGSSGFGRCVRPSDSVRPG